jgi:hypothetical protein
MSGSVGRRTRTPRARADGSLELERAAERLDSLGRGGESDVALLERIARAPLLHAGSVIADLERDLVFDPAKPHAHASPGRVLRGVGDELSNERKDELVVRSPVDILRQLESEAKIASLSVVCRNSLNGRL